MENGGENHEGDEDDASVQSTLEERTRSLMQAFDSIEGVRAENPSDCDENSEETDPTFDIAATSKRMFQFFSMSLSRGGNNNDDYNDNNNLNGEESLETPLLSSSSQQLREAEAEQGGQLRGIFSCFGCCSSSPSSYSSLAFASSTPRVWTYLVPLLCWVSHVLFYIGQTGPMWRLSLHQDVDVWTNATGTITQKAFDTLGFSSHNLNYVQSDSTRDIWGPVSFLYSIQELWKGHGMDSDTMFLPRLCAFMLLWVSGVWPHLKLFLLQCMWFWKIQSTKEEEEENNNDASRNQTNTSTGIDSVNQSNSTSVAPSSLLQQQQESRRIKIRSNILRWLSILGKWSLADVLVVCVMIGVLNHIEWDVDANQFLYGVNRQLPTLLNIAKSAYPKTQTLCEMMLGFTCDDATIFNKPRTRTKCLACTAFVKSAYNHPDWAQSTGKTILNGVKTSGGGIMELRVYGMGGIYFFCIAVIVSVGLSVLVDFIEQNNRRQYHQKQRQQQLQQKQDHQQPQSSSSSVRGLEWEMARSTQNQQRNSDRYSYYLEAHERLQQRRLQEERQQQQEQRRSRKNRERRRWKIFRLILTITALSLILMAVYLPTMDRVIGGKLTEIIRDILGVDWDRSYSLHTLMSETGAAGGHDHLLMWTFALFVVVGPILRIFLILLDALLDLCCSTTQNNSHDDDDDACDYDKSRSHNVLQTLIDSIGAFCAWEVLVISVFMVGTLVMPPSTRAIIQDEQCSPWLSPEERSKEKSCFEAVFDMRPSSFGFCVVGGGIILLVLGSWKNLMMIVVDDSEPLHRHRHRRNNENGRQQNNSNNLLRNHDLNLDEDEGISLSSIVA